MTTAREVLRALAAAAALAPTAAWTVEVRPGVEFAGVLEPAGSERAGMQALVFDFAAAWSTCDPEWMRGAMAEDVTFAYPTSVRHGLRAALEDLAVFCGQATQTSVYFPADAFYIDEANGRIAAEAQFRTIQRGARQVVNDVWIATVADGRIVVLKEYLDGRVKDLQALGVLRYDPGAEFLTPWQPRTEAWADCFPIVRAAPINSCPPEN